MKIVSKHFKGIRPNVYLWRDRELLISYPSLPFKMKNGILEPYVEFEITLKDSYRKVTDFYDPRRGFVYDNAYEILKRFDIDCDEMTELLEIDEKFSRDWYFVKDNWGGVNLNKGPSMDLRTEVTTEVIEDNTVYYVIPQENE